MKNIQTVCQDIVFDNIEIGDMLERIDESCPQYRRVIQKDDDQYIKVEYEKGKHVSFPIRSFITRNPYSNFGLKIKNPINPNIKKVKANVHSFSDLLGLGLAKAENNQIVKFSITSFDPRGKTRIPQPGESVELIYQNDKLMRVRSCKP